MLAPARVESVRGLVFGTLSEKSPSLADYIGPHKILWATDYPHPDGFFPGAPKLIANRPELSAETKRQILGGGARGFYKLA